MLREIGNWILQDDQEVLFEFVFTILLNILFLVLFALLLWALHRFSLAFTLAKGYGVLWVVVWVTFVFLNQIQRSLRINIYDRSEAFVALNLFMSCFLQTGWAAFAARTLQNAVYGESGWMVIALYLIGGVSCLVAFFVVSAFYQGHIYRLVSLPLALVSFPVFSIWPAAGDALYGWFFNLF